MPWTSSTTVLSLNCTCETPLTRSILTVGTDQLPGAVALLDEVPVAVVAGFDKPVLPAATGDDAVAAAAYEDVAGLAADEGGDAVPADQRVLPRSLAMSVT